MTAERLTVDRDKMAQTAKLAVEAVRNQTGIFAKEITPPETNFIKLIKEQGQKLGDDRYPLHALFFLLMTLYADNSEIQLRYVANPERFRKNSWIFQPEVVVQTPEDQVLEAADNLIRPGYNRAGFTGWMHNARLITEKYDGDLRNFFQEHGNSAPKVLEALVGPRYKKDHQGFRRFGPKLARLLLLWVDKYDLVKLQDVETIGIPVDFQVARIAIQTGAIELSGPITKERVTDALNVELPTVISELGLDNSEVSEALWQIGNKACNNFDHDKCPLADICTRMISRKAMDEDGLYDPTDVGRFKTRQMIRREVSRRPLSPKEQTRRQRNRLAIAERLRKTRLTAGQQALPISEKI